MPSDVTASIELNGIGELFYETRVLQGREWTLSRFASESLGGAVDPVMLGYIEKGRRFPNEGLVRRVAALRGEDPRRLLAVLGRDRMLKAIGKELQKILEAEGAVSGLRDAELAVRVSMAIAALPDDGGSIDVNEWRQDFSAPLKRRKNAQPLPEEGTLRVRAILLEQELIVIDGTEVRRSGRHYVPKNTEERSVLALEYCVLFLKGLLDRLAFPDESSGTYLRNHYFNIERDKLPEFQQRLDEALRKLAEEYAAEASDETEFLNVLATATYL
jgi:hypothetical protein